jgi:hypothetical protein
MQSKFLCKHCRRCRQHLIFHVPGSEGNNTIPIILSLAKRNFLNVRLCCKNAALRHLSARRKQLMTNVPSVHAVTIGLAHSFGW